MNFQNFFSLFFNFFRNMFSSRANAVSGRQSFERHIRGGYMPHAGKPRKPGRNERSRVRCYKNGPTLSRFEEHLIRTGVIVRSFHTA